VDKIDLTGLFGEDTSFFSFIGTDAFILGETSQVRVAQNAGSRLLQIDADADAVVDAEIELSGFDGSGLDENDFSVG
jgi:hypothetical protein